MKRINRGDRVRVKGGNVGEEFEVEYIIKLKDNRTHVAIFKGTSIRIAISTLELVKI